LLHSPLSPLPSPLFTPKTWEEWITLPIREQDEAVHTVRGQIRVPTVIVAVNYAKVPKKRPKLGARTIRERDGNRCQYTGRVLRPDEGSLDHVVPRSRGGKDAWENPTAGDLRCCCLVQGITWNLGVRFAHVQRLGGDGFLSKTANEYGSVVNAPPSQRAGLRHAAVEMKFSAFLVRQTRRMALLG